MKSWARERDLLIAQTLSFVEGITGDDSPLRATLAKMVHTPASDDTKQLDTTPSATAAEAAVARPHVLDSHSNAAVSAEPRAETDASMALDAPVDGHETISASHLAPVAFHTSPLSPSPPQEAAAEHVFGPANRPEPELTRGVEVSSPASVSADATFDKPVGGVPGAGSMAQPHAPDIALPARGPLFAIAPSPALTGARQSLSARDEIAQRVAAFKAHQARFQRERERRCDEILSRAMGSARNQHVH